MVEAIEGRQRKPHARARSPRRAWRGVAWRGVAKYASTRHAREWSGKVFVLTLRARGFLLLRRLSLPHPRRRRAITVGRAGSTKPASPCVPARGRGRIRFLGSAIATARCPSTSSRRSRWSASTVCLVYFCIVSVPTTPL